MQNLHIIGLNPEEFKRDLLKSIEEVFSMVEKQKESEKQLEFLTAPEVAKILRVSEPTIRRWTKKGLLRSYGIGSGVLYKRHEIEDCLIDLTPITND